MGTISGVTKDSSGNPCAAQVRVYRLDTGALVSSVVSNATTGAYSVTTADTAPHVVVRHVSTPTAADPQWGSTTIFLPLETADGFADLKGGAVTQVGSPTISTAQSPFSIGSSAYFNGASQYIEGSVSITSGSDFTIEFLIYFPSSPANGFFELGGGILFNNNAGKFRLYCFEDITTSGTVPDLTTGTWHHVAVTRASGSIRGFVNGTQVGTTLTGYGTSTPSGDAKYRFGKSNAYGSFCACYVSQFRVTNYARYTSSFTALSAPMLTVGGVGTPTENAQIFDNVTPT